jgi:pSer/pThr/pTyr-binding forkhead associated (FHA) protein
MASSQGSGTTVQWFLEGSLGHGHTWLMPIEKLPFTIGRHESSSLELSSPKISRHHAVIDEIGGTWRVRDQTSTNGTLLNRQPLRDARNDVALQAGDALHFGGLGFRLITAQERANDEPGGNSIAVWNRRAVSR